MPQGNPVAATEQEPGSDDDNDRGRYGRDRRDCFTHGDLHSQRYPLPPKTVNQALPGTPRMAPIEKTTLPGSVPPRNRADGRHEVARPQRQQHRRWHLIAAHIAQVVGPRPPESATVGRRHVQVHAGQRTPAPGQRDRSGHRRRFVLMLIGGLWLMGSSPANLRPPSPPRD